MGQRYNKRQAKHTCLECTVTFSCVSDMQSWQEVRIKIVERWALLWNLACFQRRHTSLCHSCLSVSVPVLRGAHLSPAAILSPYHAHSYIVYIHVAAQHNNELRALSPQANCIDWVTATCRWNLVPIVKWNIKGHIDYINCIVTNHSW
jgi:hypothetical protein